MVAEAVDIVSLDQVKTELRLGGDTTASRTTFSAHDDLLTQHIQAAVSFVEGETGLVLLNRQEIQLFRGPAGSLEWPLVLEDVRDIVSVDRIRYWTPSASLSGGPDGNIPSDSLRLVTRQAGWMFHPVVYPPADGWPAVRKGSKFEVQFTTGRAIADIPPAVISGIVLCIRQLYDGYREIRPTEAFYSLIRPWRQL